MFDYINVFYIKMYMKKKIHIYALYVANSQSIKPRGTL